jgi:type I restriction enzyme S subunit
MTYIPESKKNRLCNEDDILLGRYGASVGKVLIRQKGAYNVAVMKTIPDTHLIAKDYLYYYLISDEFQARLSQVAARSAQAGFSKEDIYNFPVLTPALEEQNRIVGCHRQHRCL